MRFSTVVPTAVLLMTASVFAQGDILSALGGVASAAVESVKSEGVAAISDGVLGSATTSTATGTATSTDIVGSTSSVSSAMSSGTGTTTLGINGTSTLTGALPTGTGNGTNNGTKNGTESAAMGMGVHAAQYVLPGVAAVGAIVYSGFLGL